MFNLKFTEKKREISQNTDSPALPKKTAGQITKEQKQRLKNLEKSSEKKLKDINRKLNFERVPSNVQKTIRYKRMFENGICEVVDGLYSKTIQFADINYQSSRIEDKEDIFAKYCRLINYIDPSVFLQINVINRRVDRKVFEREMLIPLHGKELDKYRKEMNTMFLDKAMQGENGMLHEKYLTISVLANSYKNAVSTLSKHEANIIDFLSDIGCSCHTLTGIERLRVLHALLRPDDEFSFRYQDLLYSNLNTKDYICPPSFDFSEAPAWYRFGEKYGQTIFLRDYPSEMTDTLIAAIADLPLDLNISLHMLSIDQTEALDYVRTQIAFMEQQKIDEQKKALKSGYDMDLISHELTDSLDQALKLKEALEKKDQRMLKVALVVNTFADDEETLAENVFQIKAAAKTKANGSNFANLEFCQSDALNTSLPLGLKSIDVKRMMITASAAIMIPFTSQELYQPGGNYYGLNKISRNLIFFNRRNLNAPTGFILGPSGSGKSFAAKREMASVLLSSDTDEVIVIDPEREFTVMAENFGGEIINISAGSPHHINPMDISVNYAGKGNPLMLKSEFILSLCTTILGGVSPVERSLLDRICNITYGKYFANPKKNPMPTLTDFYNNLLEAKIPEAQQLALALEVYIKGSLSTFAHQTNVNTNKRFIVYDLKDLGTSLKTLGMMIVLDQIWNRITDNYEKGIRTWFYTDEYQLITENELAEKYYFDVWSRARKWGAVATGITQNVETLVLSDISRRMLSNSGFVMLMQQSYHDRIELAKILNISNEQLRYIDKVKPGHGLLFAQKAIVPFEDDFPKSTELYRMMTTKVEDIFNFRAQKEIV